MTISPQSIAEDALRLIGEYSIHDEGADQDAIDQALHWLDLSVAQLSGSHHIFWLIPANLDIPLQAAKATYDLTTDVSPDTVPASNLQFPIDCWVRDSAGNRNPVEIITRRRYEELDRHDTAGRPDFIQIHRTAPPFTATIYPVPNADQGPYTIELLVQTYAPEFLSAPSDTSLFLVGKSWARWAAYQTAVDIGAGPVRTIPKSERDEFRGVAAIAESQLLAFENRQHRPVQYRRVQYVDLG